MGSPLVADGQKGPWLSPFHVLLGRRWALAVAIDGNRLATAAEGWQRARAQTKKDGIIRTELSDV